MGDAINIYCDESCHLEHDGQHVMVIGAVWCPCDAAREISRELRKVKWSHRMPGPRAGAGFEMKWKKISPAKVSFALALVEQFFSDERLHFRGVIVPDKEKLDHGAWAQTHDDWYYKMFFDLLKVIIFPHNTHRIFIDIKDAQSWRKSQKLGEILSNAHYDCQRKIIELVQPIRSEESEQIQLADLLIGAVMAANRGNIKSRAKQAVVDRVRALSGYTLTGSTWLREDKFNLLRWRAGENDA
ncbi:MAG: DUF3800 domain-containing protein [Planctomycetota bacterium]